MDEVFVDLLVSLQRLSGTYYFVWLSIVAIYLEINGFASVN